VQRVVQAWTDGWGNNRPMRRVEALVDAQS
jgi:hypothetical protein